MIRNPLTLGPLRILVTDTPNCLKTMWAITYYPTPPRFNIMTPYRDLTITRSNA